MVRKEEKFMQYRRSLIKAKKLKIRITKISDKKFPCCMCEKWVRDGCRRDLKHMKIFWNPKNNVCWCE